MASLNILLLVGTIVVAVLEVFLICAAGFLMARMDILNKQTRKQINRLNTTLFTPALLFTKVAFSLTGSQLKQLWIIPVLFTLVTAISAASAYGLGRVCRLKATQRNFAMSAAMFMNSNSMPIALMQSLISTVSALKMNSDDDTNSMLSRALTYLVLYSTLGNVARWSFGVKILEKADDGAPDVVAEEKNLSKAKDLEASEVVDINASKTADATPTHSRLPSEASTIDPASPTRNNSDRRFYLADDEDATRLDLSRQQTTDLSRTNTMLDVQGSRPPLSTMSSMATLAPSNSQTFSFAVPPATNKNEDSKASFGPEVSEPEQPVSLPRRFLRAIKRFWIGFYKFMTMPLWAALASIIIALIPPVQNIIANHLAPVRDALEQAGNCSIPLTLVVLGAYFYTPPPKDAPKRTLKEKVLGIFKRRDENAVALEQTKPIPGQTRTIVVSIVARMIICPLIMLPIMLGFVKLGSPSVFNDPVFVVSNVLLTAAPVALTLAQMSTKTGCSEAFEKQLSKTIFWSYCVALTPTTIVYVVLGLLVAKM